MMNYENYKNTKRMFAVTCECGHVGRNNYIIKTFALIASNGGEAAAKARNIPRVKHDHKDCIRDVVEIDEDEFNRIIKENDNDPYLKCTSRQMQRAYCFDIYENIGRYDRTTDRDEYQEKRRERIQYKQKKYRSIERDTYRG